MIKEEKKMRIKIDILPNNTFLKDDGTFDKEEAIKLSGKIAGICYDEEGFSHLENEPEETTMRRVNRTINNGHHSVYDHISLSLNLQHVPKILAMVLNNEHEYTTAEKSARYTPIVREEDSIITLEEEKLYNKWLEIFKIKIKEKYGNIYKDGKIQKLAQENARYLVTVFMPTQMIYTTTFRQINYIASWMLKYIEQVDKSNEFDSKLASSMKEFIEELSNKNILDERLMRNEKYRNLSLFGKNLVERNEQFGYVYTMNYKGSFAQYAQAQRHRTLYYQLEIMKEKEYFVPPIIEDDKMLVEEWLGDMQIVKNVMPQGELVYINESGIYDNFILKCKERLCTGAQLEIMLQTKRNLLKYKQELEKQNNPLAKDIVKYSNGARCTFPDFYCTEDCKFKEGKMLSRKI